AGRRREGRAKMVATAVAPSAACRRGRRRSDDSLRRAMRTTTPFLDIEYIDSGPREKPVVLLLHGWPDDATTWADVSVMVNDAGLRTIVPFLRGFGGTKFRDPSTPRTGSPGILALDAIDLMDALGIGNFVVAGHDWGSNVAEALAVGWPDRVPRIAMLSTPP